MSTMAALNDIKEMLRRNSITQAEAEKMAAPLIAEFNRISEEKAKKFNVPPKRIFFKSFMRCHV